MEKHTIEILEFNKILENLSSYSLGPAGADLLFMQEVISDPEEWEILINAVFSIKKLFDDNIYFPDVTLPDLRSALKKIAVPGSVIECHEAGDVLTFLQSSSRIKKHLLSNTGSTLINDNIDFFDSTDIQNSISRYIKNDGTIKEENIKELKNIKIKTANVNKEINRVVSRLINDTGFSSCLQEKSSTLKESRIVFPVNGNFKGKIKGIVHGSSSSGLTIFIEPFELCELNNEIIDLEEKYRIEILKILRIITETIRENITAIDETVKKISIIDTIIARAKFACNNNCIKPELIKKGLILKNIKHYLLGKSAVPVDLVIQENTGALIISGPNTGGKTVALKTAGLAVLMNQFGIGIPADEGSSLSIFDNILADIGDEQSIASSLSTFSAHMKNLSAIIEKSTHRSLVLLDEPGSGTDPEEGASISLALFDYLLDNNIFFIATTHQGVIKNYAASHGKVENVSVAYDPETYMPEYRIIYGIPGESFGIDIAMKNGLPDNIILKAREYLGSEKININRLLKEISLKQKNIFDKEAELSDRSSKLTEKIREIDLKELRLKQKENEILVKEKKEISSFLSESRKQIENIIRNIKEHDADSNSITEARAFIDELLIKEKDTEEIIENGKQKGFNNYRQDPEGLLPGKAVFIGENKKKGRIIRKSRKNRYIVSAGDMKIEVDIKNIYLADAEQSDKDTIEKKVVIKSGIYDIEKPVFELDLRGLRLDEAIMRLEKQLDSAIINNLSSFSVIHGYGEGILQKGVRDFLENCSAVSKFYYAIPEHGGFGKTIVEL